jgi:sarcosine oxidase subunit gamma
VVEPALALRASAVSRNEPVTLHEATFAIAWNVRGDARRGELASTVQQGFGVPLPAPLASASSDGTTLLWLGPRSWLVVIDVANAALDFERARSSINASGGALFDVSASYVAWSIAGANARTVLNRGCPLDFRERSFPRGHCAQSTLGHVNALFYRPADAPAYVVMVARSLARDAWHALTATTAHQMGPAVTFSMSAPGSATAG